MIRLIEALNFRCLRYVRQPLDNFHVLVGPNASGKSTFLDVVAFLARVVSDGVGAAIDERTQNFEDLLWCRQGDCFELAVEAAVPENKRESKRNYDTIRYEIRIGIDPASNKIGILEERAMLKNWVTPRPVQRPRFPLDIIPPLSILSRKAKAGQRTTLVKSAKGKDNFYSEVPKEPGKFYWFPSIRLGPSKSALGNLLEEDTWFPITSWLKKHLAEETQTLLLNSRDLRRPSTPGQGRSFKTDGSNLPWVINELAHSNRRRFKEWLGHVRTALPEIENIKTIERPEDRHRYLEICYYNGFRAPSWVVSDGTLRLLALTIPAYLPELTGVFLIEEPENGIHPLAVDTIFQSLSSVYNAQILLATHSPVILSMAKQDQVLCFKQTESGATDIVAGNGHPALRDWKGLPDLSILFASGVLG
jgi:predicted ATPase